MYYYYSKFCQIRPYPFHVLVVHSKLISISISFFVSLTLIGNQLIALQIFVTFDFCNCCFSIWFLSHFDFLLMRHFSAPFIRFVLDFLLSFFSFFFQNVSLFTLNVCFLSFFLFLILWLFGAFFKLKIRPNTCNKLRTSTDKRDTKENTLAFYTKASIDSLVCFACVAFLTLVRRIVRMHWMKPNHFRKLG